VQVRLLGSIDVTAGGVARQVPGLRRKAVLAALALCADQIVGTDRLADIVWGGRAPATAQNTLQSHVSYLRRVLGSRAAILARAPGYVLDLGDDATDVAVAERLIRQAAQSADPVRAARDLQVAVDLWRGPSMADVGGLDWLCRQGERLDHLLLQAQQALAERRLEIGEHVELVPELQRLVQRHPLHEHLHALLILALYRAGRQADALAAYRRLRRTLGEDLGIDPSQPLRDLEAAVLRQDAALDTPPAATTLLPSAVGWQLPAAATPLLGRDADTAAVVRLLTSSASRLVTLTGPGGVGKTRLALAAAATLAPHFADGVAFVSLAALRDPAGFLSTIADSLGLRALGERSVADTLRAYLHGRRLLLVLDNVEHLLPAAPEVAALLAAAPALSVLVTSRSRLRVQGEWVYPVAPLASPAAAQLFGQRAEQAGTGPYPAEPAVVDAICHRLDNLPLAIELAAARTRTLPPRSLLARLDPVLSILDRGAQDLPQRQQTLRNTVAWSHDLLTSAEQAMFRTMAVFCGSWTPEAAAAVAQVDEHTSMDLHAALVDASLIAGHPRGGQPRFEMLDTIRCYATEQLTVSGELDAVRDRHARYYRDWAVATAAQLSSPDRPDVLDDLELEHNNLRGTLRSLLDRAEAAGAAEVCAALSLFWTIRGHWWEGQAWADDVLAIGDGLAVATRAKLHLMGGWLRYPAGRHDEAAISLAEAARLARADANPVTLSLVLAMWTSVEVERGRLEAAAGLVAETEALSDQLGLPDVAPRRIVLKAKLALGRGDLLEVDQLCTAHAGQLRAHTPPWMLSVVLRMHGSALLLLGHHARAEDLLQESVLISARMGDTWALLHQLASLAHVAALRRDPHRAATLYGAVDALLQQTGATILPTSRQFIVSGEQTAIDAIGPDTFRSGRLEGSQLSIEDMISLALGTRSRPVAAPYPALSPLA
jgi:predicted ATPase/DNA-binding SARP family transcriptional activator